jgi:acyl transferase domain-containing protein
MGRELYESEAVFRDALDGCAKNLLKHLQLDIRTVLYPTESARQEAEKQINETRVTQPAIFTVEFALASLWRSWGVHPSLLIGDSVGEYVVAVLAGVFSLEDALGMLAGRAKLMQDLPGGSMLSVRKNAAELEGKLPADVAIAAINSPLLTTLSGPSDTLRDLQVTLEASGTMCRLLPTSHAFHSSMMDSIVEPFQQLADNVAQESPTIPWISTYTGEWMNERNAPDGKYWAGQLRNTVRFGNAIEKALNGGALVFLEVGPGQALTQLVRQQKTDVTTLSSLGTYNATSGELEALLTSLGQLWLVGVEPDWNAFYVSEDRRRLQLPTYPFERKSYWIAPPPKVQVKKQSQEGAPGHWAASTETQSATLAVIERQVQIMAKQLEMVRKRAEDGNSKNANK